MRLSTVYCKFNCLLLRRNYIYWHTYAAHSSHNLLTNVSNHSYSRLEVAKLNKCTYKGLPTSLCYFHEAFCKIHPILVISPQKCCWRISVHLLQVQYLVTFLCVCVCVCARARARACVLHFSSLVSVSLQICSSVKHVLKQRTARNAMLHSGHLSSVLILLCI
jgi:hypothetical protein